MLQIADDTFWNRKDGAIESLSRGASMTPNGGLRCDASQGDILVLRDSNRQTLRGDTNACLRYNQWDPSLPRPSKIWGVSYAV